MSNLPVSKAYKTPPSVGTIPVKVDKTQYVKPPVVGPVLNVGSIPSAPKPSAAPSIDAAVNKVVYDTQLKEPVLLTRYRQASAGVSPIAAQAAQKDGDFKKWIKDITGGAKALVGPELTVGEKAKAIGNAPLQLTRSFAASINDFGRIVLPKAVVTGIKALADNINDEGGGRQGGLPDLRGEKVRSLVNKGTKWASDWAETVITGYDELQRESLERQGITEDSSIADPNKLGYGIGSGISSIGAYLGITALTKNPTAAAATLGWVEGSATYNDALTKIKTDNPNMSDDAAEKKAAGLAITNAAGIALLEKVGMDALFRNFAGGRLRNAVIGTFTESAQEGTQTMWSNLVEKYGYDKSKSIYEGVFETLITTMPIGFFGGGAFSTPDVVSNTFEDIPNPDEVPPEELQAVATEIADKLKAEAESFRQSIGNPTSVLDADKALKQDIREQVELRGRDAVIEQIASEDVREVDLTQDEAANLVDEAMSDEVDFASTLPPDIMADIEAARAVVQGTKAEPATVAEDATAGIEDLLEDIPEAVAAEAESVWEERYAEQYGDLESDVAEINEQMKTAKTAERAALSEQKAETVKKQVALEQEFIAEFQPKIEEAKKTKIETAIAKVEQTVQAPKENLRESLPASIQSDLRRYEQLDRSGEDINTDDLLARIVASLKQRNMRFKFVGEYPNRTIEVEPLDGVATSGTIETNDNPTTKSPDRDTGGSVRQTVRAAGDSARGEGSNEGGAADTVDSERVARGEDSAGSDGAGKRPSDDVATELGQSVKKGNKVEYELNGHTLVQDKKGGNFVVYDDKGAFVKAVITRQDGIDYITSVGSDIRRSPLIKKIEKQKLHDEAFDALDTHGLSSAFVGQYGGNAADTFYLTVIDGTGKGFAYIEDFASYEDGAARKAELEQHYIKPEGIIDIGSEEVVYTNAGVVSISKTTPIAAKQKTKIGKTIVAIIEQNEQDLRDESLFLTVQAEGFMPLHIERLPTNELAVSHTYTQNGDLMRDPEVVFLIDKDGQLNASTIENTAFGVAMPIAPNDSFLNMWAENLKSQGFIAKSKKEAVEAARDEISALEADLRAIYLNAKPDESPMEGYTAADEVLTNILTQLELAEAGSRVFIDGEVRGVASTYPEWIPDNARERADVDYGIAAFGDVRGFSYPKGTNETKRRLFADALFEQMDIALDVDTKSLRNKILSFYEEADTLTGRVEEPAAEVQNGNAGEPPEAQRGEVTPEQAILNVINDYAYVGGAGVVGITNNKLPTQADLKTINSWQPAGGREAQGAEGRGLLDEYYTPAPVIDMVRSMLDTLGAFAADNVRVLEPSVGIGNFLYTLPANARVTGYEINETSAKIAKINHPDATIIVKPFEELFIDKNGNKKSPEQRYEVVVGNPPYGDHRGLYKGLGEEAKIGRYETYFMKRSLDLTTDGGYVAMVVPSSFMRSSVKEAGKREMAATGKLVGAVRLPNGTFSTTGIGTDILVFKKHATTSGIETEARIAEMSTDAYFTNNPDRVLGETTTRRGRFGDEEAVSGSIEDALEKFATLGYEPVELTVPEPTKPKTTIASLRAALDATVSEMETAEEATTAEKEAALTESTARVTERQSEDSDKQLAKIKAAGLKVGDTVQRFSAASDGIGSMTETGTIVKKDGSSFLYVETEGQATEMWNENWYAPVDAPVVSRQTIDLAPTASETAEDGQWQYVSASGELEGNFDPEKAYYMKGKYYNAFNYAQGDIYQKLEWLQEDYAAINNKAKYEKQKAMLEAVLPPRHTIDRMILVPHTNFVATLKVGDKTLQDLFLSWLKTLPMTAFGESSFRDVTKYTLGEAVRGGDKLQNERDRRTRRIEGDRLFKLFLNEDLSPAKKTVVEDAFNEQFNSYHRPDYKQVPLVSKLSATFNGKPLEVREVQRQGIGFLLNKGVGLLAHDVGLGKTMQGIITNIELLERGWAKRPLIVLPSASVYRQWLSEIRQLKPDIKINELANLGADFKGDLASLSIPDGTLSVITTEGFQKLGFTDAMYEQLTRDLQDVIENPNDQGTKRKSENQKAKTEETIGKARRGTSAERTFEDLGFDSITVDEIHNYNHIISSAKTVEKSKNTEFRGFTQTPSIAGLKLWLAAQYIQDKTGGRNVIGLSATPFTNHPLEYYSILSLFAMKRMQAMGIRNVNDFMSMYMAISSKDEVNPDGKGVSAKLAVRGFNNAKQFQALLKEFIDFRDGEEAGIVRPERHGREFLVPENQMSFDYKQQAQELFELKEAGTLQAMTELQKIAFSPYASRYHQGKVPTSKEFVEGSPKIKLALELLTETYKRVKDSNHIIYSKTGKEYLPHIKAYLVSEMGIPADQIEIITGSVAKPKRSKIQADFNAGKIRVILGNEAIEEGINLQAKTTDMYILSQPWNFTQVRQTIGRAWRQGNQWRNVRINQFFTENTFDVYLSQTLEKKRVRYQKSLQDGEDYVDSGDIDYESMSLDLITDPVLRTRMAFVEKRTMLDQQIKREEADFAQRNRRNADFIEAAAKVAEYKEYVVRRPEAEWAKREVERYTGKLNNLRATLRERGIDVDVLDSELAKSEALIEELKAAKTALTAEEDAAVLAAEGEALINVATSKPIDYKRFVNERRNDDENLFIGGAPMFQAVHTDHVTLATLEALQEEIKKDTITRVTLDAFLARPRVKQIEKDTIRAAADAVQEGENISIEALVKQTEKDLLLLDSVVVPPRYESVNLPYEAQRNTVSYTEKIYTSPIKNRAARVHFGSEPINNYFAHVRSSDLKTGNVRQIVEVQSDLFQKGRLEDEGTDFTFDEEDTFYRQFTEFVAKEKGISLEEADDFIEGAEIAMVPEDPMFGAFMAEQERNLQTDRAPLMPYRNTWWERVIREELKTAAQEGIASVEVPVGATAMQIEGLGSKESWYEFDEDDMDAPPPITATDLYVGKVITQNSYATSSSDAWVVTEILPNDKFKAVRKNSLVKPIADKNYSPEDIEKLNKQYPGTLHFEDGSYIGRSFIEQFDISGNIDTENPIYKFYEKQVGKYLTNNYGATRITDEKGIEWWQVRITPEMATQPTLAFQTLPTRRVDGKFTGSLSKADRMALARSMKLAPGTDLKRAEKNPRYRLRMRATTFESARRRLEQYKKRFNLKFDVELAERIFWQGGSVRNKILSETEAYAVYFNRAITLTAEMPMTTADHEFIHLVLDNIADIPAFAGFTKESILTAANGGKSIKNLTEVELRTLEEKVAVGFEGFIIDKMIEDYQVKQKYGEVLGGLYLKLRELILDLYRSFGGNMAYAMDDTLADNIYRVTGGKAASFRKGGTAFRKNTGIMADFYDRVARSEETGEEPTIFLQNPVRASKVKFETPEGLKYLDFTEYMVRQDEIRTASRAAMFQAVTQPADELMTNKVFQNENKLNFVMKDLNTLEDITAQARDIYLKEPEQFKQANEIELIGEAHDADKNQLDNKFAETLQPYMKLTQAERDRVDEVLWRGDEMGKEFDDKALIYMSLNDNQIAAYKAVRYSLDMAHEMLLLEMQRKGVDQAEIDTFRQEREGYMPHKWIPKLSTTQKLKSFVKGKEVFVLKHQRKVGMKYETWHMDAFASEQEALARQKELMEENKEFDVRYAVDKLSSLEVDFFSSQELTSEKMIAVIEQMKEKRFVKDEVVDLLKKNLLDMFKEKGFGRHYLRRTGVRGYDTDNTGLILAEYFSGFSGYVTKMRWSTSYFNALAQIDARRQQRFFGWARDLIAYKLNNKPEWRTARTIAFAWYLANDLSYLLVNATQNWTVGVGELSKYTTGADKAWKPEAYLLKATNDWALKRVSPSERAVIDGLLEKGQLGAEMTSEMMGFKNNPLYNEISSGFNKIMYASTAIVEKNINRIPAFLAARRLLKEQGMSDTQANAKALEISNDIHFRYGRHHRPRMLRGRVNVLFVFQHYIRSLLYQLYRDASRREYIAFTRKMMYTSLLGGVTSLPFAKLFLLIFSKIADDEDDEELKEELSYWEILVQRGIPATFDIDLSSRVGIEMLSVNKIIDNPTDVRTYMGTIGDLIFKRPFEVVALAGQERWGDAFAKALPDMFANPLRAYNGYMFGVRSFAGVPLEDADGNVYKYNSWEALIKAMGFTPTQEGLLWEERGRQWDRETKQREQATEVGRTVRGMVQRGEIDEAREFQQQAIEEGLIKPTSDYVRDYASPIFYENAVEAWNSSNKSRSELERIEEELIENVYNGIATDLQRNNARKELAVYRQFGMDNPDVSDIMKASTNAEKVEILLDIRANIGEEAFQEFLDNGRTKMSTEAGSRVPILLSDDLMDLLRTALAN